MRCTVWWTEPVGDAAAAAAVAVAAGLLDGVEQARCAALRRSVDRARFVTGRVLARHALAAELGVDPAAVALRTRCPICGGAHGKPRPAGAFASDVDVSIAHAGDRVLVAVCRGAPVGVDVEAIRGAGELADARAGVLAAEERAAVAALAPALREAAVVRLWTRKEALLKASGHGVTVALDGLRVTGPRAPPRVLAWPPGVPPHAAQMLDLDLGSGYRACVAALTERDVDWGRLSPAGSPSVADQLLRRASCGGHRAARDDALGEPN